MVFSSFEFLFRFLPFFLLIYYIVPKNCKNLILFAGSIIFYAVGDVEYVLLLLLCALVNYCAAGLMNRAALEERRALKRFLLILTLGYNFGVLFLYKYSGIVDELPLGISFYTFQIAAYALDVYWEKIPVEKSFVKLGTYLTMFPQLVAGPIINYSEVCLSLDKRRVTPEDFEDGLKSLILGLGAKVVIADRIGILWNNIQMIGFDSISTQLAWMGAFAFSLQLYFDFAGYSMMAIGLGRMLGFKIPVNFRQPYMSKSVSEFWRRWHITLGRWFREYVYIPLGGNRKGRVRTFFNLFIVWSLTALWHGADGNYLVWGAMLLTFLTIEKLFLQPALEQSKILGHIYVLFVIPLAWVAFAITDVEQLGLYFTRLFPFVGRTIKVVNTLDYVKYGKEFLPLFMIGILFATPLPTILYQRVKKKWLGSIAVAVILTVSIYYLAVSVNNPFMYFNF